jgi:hypothetical protein
MGRYPGVTTPPNPPLSLGGEGGGGSEGGILTCIHTGQGSQLIDITPPWSPDLCTHAHIHKQYTHTQTHTHTHTACTSTRTPPPPPHTHVSSHTLPDAARSLFTHTQRFSFSLSRALSLSHPPILRDPPTSHLSRLLSLSLFFIFSLSLYPSLARACMHA